MEVFVLKAGQQTGPYSVDDLNRMLEAEEIVGEDLCWYEGCETWVPLSKFPGFIPAPSAQHPFPPPPPRTHQPAPAPVTPVAKPKRKVMNGCLIAALSVAGLGVLAIGGCLFLGTAFVSGVNKQVEAQATEVHDTTNEKLKALETATPSDLRADGDLEKEMQFFGDYTALQRENEEKKIKGAIVQWTLTVFDVHSEGDHYRVQTGDTDKVNTFLTLYALNDADRNRISSLKAGDSITVRGYVDGISSVFRHIEIDPAILVP